MIHSHDIPLSEAEHLSAETSTAFLFLHVTEVLLLLRLKQTLNSFFFFFFTSDQHITSVLILFLICLEESSQGLNKVLSNL